MQIVLSYPPQTSHVLFDKLFNPENVSGQHGMTLKILINKLEGLYKQQ